MDIETYALLNGKSKRQGWGEQPDYSQWDASSPSYIKNRPFYEDNIEKVNNFTFIEKNDYEPIDQHKWPNPYSESIITLHKSDFQLFCPDGMEEAIGVYYTQENKSTITDYITDAEDLGAIVSNSTFGDAYFLPDLNESDYDTESKIGGIILTSPDINTNGTFFIGLDIVTMEEVDSWTFVLPFVDSFTLDSFNQSEDFTVKLLKNSVRYCYVFRSNSIIPIRNGWEINDNTLNINIDGRLLKAQLIDGIFDYEYGTKEFFVYIEINTDPSNTYVHIESFNPIINLEITYNATYREYVLSQLDDKFISNNIMRVSDFSNTLFNIRYNEIVMNDQSNGYQYILKIDNGEVVCECATDHISITELPNQLEYVEGESFKTDGMIVTATAQDGTTKVITNYDYEKYVSSNIVTISYVEGGIVFTADININYTNIEDALVDFTYTTNDDDTYTITGWKETLNGVNSTECIVPNSHLILI